MSLTPILVLVVMVLVGGVIAYTADNLGRKIGKKRLSFLGLRPRYTATLLTVGSGVVIPLITILVLLAVSSDVREWVQRGVQAIAEAQRLEKQNQTARADNQRLRDERQELTEKAESLQKSVESLNKQNKDVSERLKTSLARVKQAAAELVAATRQTRTLKSQVASLNADIDQLDVRIKRREGEYAELNKTYNQIQASYTVVDRERQEAFQEVADLNKEVENLEKERDALKAEVARLDTARQDLEKRYNEIDEILKRVQKELQDTNLQLADTYDELEQKKLQLAQISRGFEENFLASRFQPMIFEAGEELARIQMGPSLSPAAARIQLDQLFDLARKVALDRGAITPDKNPVSAGFFTRYDEQNRPITAEQQEEAVVRGITSQRDELVLIASAYHNSFKNEFVLLDVRAYRNPMVYGRNSMILEKRIDGRRTEEDILQQINTFLSVDLREKALRDKMIPRRGKDVSLLDVPSAKVLDLVRDIRSENKIIRLQVVARQDIRAADLLDVDFRIRY